MLLMSNCVLSNSLSNLLISLFTLYVNTFCSLKCLFLCCKQIFVLQGKSAGTEGKTRPQPEILIPVQMKSKSKSQYQRQDPLLSAITGREVDRRPPTSAMLQKQTVTGGTLQCRRQL